MSKILDPANIKKGVGDINFQQFYCPNCYSKHEKVNMESTYLSKFWVARPPARVGKFHMNSILEPLVI
jgi:hypothetical protein